MDITRKGVSMSINKVIITGNLTRDPELRSTPAGTPVLRFGIAVNDRHKNARTGEWEDYPNFIDCTMFGTRAEAISRFLSKGSKVAIEGKLRWSQWERDGQKHSKIEVIPDNIEFMSRRDNSQQPQQPQQQPQPQYQQEQMAGMPEPVEHYPSVYDEDIPF